MTSAVIDFFSPHSAVGFTSDAGLYLTSLDDLLAETASDYRNKLCHERS